MASTCFRRHTQAPPYVFLYPGWLSGLARTCVWNAPSILLLSGRVFFPQGDGRRGEAVRNKTIEMSETNDLLREQSDTLAENREKLLSENKKLEQQQKKLQMEKKRMTDFKMIIERNTYVYDEDAEWQLPEPGILMSAKAYQETSAVPLVEKLKSNIKNLTIKYVGLME